MNLKIGDSVKVKPGVLEPDNEEFEIGGWQGRMIKIDRESNAENILVTVEWDSQTLQQLPAEYIIDSEVEGLDWQSIVLHQSDIEKANTRDTIKELRSMQQKMDDRYYWSSFGEEGLRIEEVLKGINQKNENECAQRWLGYLESNLSFPFKAVVSLESYSTKIQDGDVVTVKSLVGDFDLYGIIANTSFERQKLEIPLLEMEVKDEKSKNCQLINDYKVWFSNV